MEIDENSMKHLNYIEGFSNHGKKRCHEGEKKKKPGLQSPEYHSQPL